MSHLEEGDNLDTIGLMNYIEKLRYSRNFTQEEFLHDVVSARQYQRYRNGVSSVPIDCIERISKKLGIETRKLYLDYDREIYKEKELVEEYYNSVVFKRFTRLEELKNHFTNYNFLDRTNKEFFTMASYLNKLFSKNISKQQFLSKIYLLVDYPNVLEFDVLRDVEIIGLLLIYQHDEKSRTDIIYQIKELQDNQESVLSGQSYFVLVMFFYFIAIDFGKQKEYLQVEKYCLKGIELLRKKHSDYALYLLYLKLASSYYYRSMIDEFKESLYKCITQTMSLHSLELTIQINDSIMEDFNIDADNFFREYLNLKN